ncbi:hypothetical protein ACJX0J_038807 [Zea mays]
MHAAVLLLIDSRSRSTRAAVEMDHEDFGLCALQTLSLFYQKIVETGTGLKPVRYPWTTDVAVNSELFFWQGDENKKKYRLAKCTTPNVNRDIQGQEHVPLFYLVIFVKHFVIEHLCLVYPLRNYIAFLNLDQTMNRLGKHIHNNTLILTRKTPNMIETFAVCNVFAVFGFPFHHTVYKAIL